MNTFLINHCIRKICLKIGFIYLILSDLTFAFPYNRLLRYSYTKKDLSFLNEGLGISSLQQSHFDIVYKHREMLTDDPLLETAILLLLSFQRHLVNLQ